MASRLRELFFGQPPDLAWPQLPAPPEGLRFRSIEMTDHPDCMAIYRANAPGRFPGGFESEFERALRRTDYLWIGACVGERLVALGGITRVASLLGENAWLAFGMVDPGMHGRGVGSWLLLARVVALPRPRESVTLYMTNVPTTAAFFVRFGFKYQGQQPAGSDRVPIDVSAAVLREPVWKRGRDMLEERGLLLDEAVVPLFDPWRAAGQTGDDAENGL